MIRRLIPFAVAIAAVLAAPAADALSTEKPVTRWFWMDGNVSTNGITRDLEAMKSLGIGGAIIMDQTWNGIKPGPVKPFSDDWFAHAEWAGREADRLGLWLGFHNCPGWSSSGGPWIRPEEAQQVLKCSERRVSGGERVELEPRGKVAVLAVPVREGEDWFEGRRTGSTVVFDSPRVIACAAIDRGTWGWTMPSGNVMPLGLNAPVSRFVVEVSEDGASFRRHAEIPKTAASPVHTLSFPRVRAKAVRITALDDKSAVSCWKKVRFSSVPRIPHADRKALRCHFRFAWETDDMVPRDSFDCPEELAIAADEVIDLSGRTEWTVPKGEWTVLAFAAEVQRDAMNHAAGRSAEGLECDKLSRRGVEAAMRGTVDRIAAIRDRTGIRAFRLVFVDSFEVPPQNWTDGFAEEFRRRRGYDLIRELPVLTGRFLVSTAHSEKVLDDYRRTYADLFAENYGAYFADCVHRRGFRLMTQPYLGPFDELRQGHAADIPAVEFWFRNPAEIDLSRLATSLAADGDRRVVAAEAFTEAPPTALDPHNEEIWALKRRGDRMFAAGVNLFELHGMVHQPSDDPKQRILFGSGKNVFGSAFDRHHPDFATFRPWIAYLTRAQRLLQAGRCVSDILYVLDGRSPERAAMNPPPPSGYRGDAVDPETLAANPDFAKRYRVVMRPGETAEVLARRLESAGIGPDFGATENGRPVGANEIAWCHRRLDDGRECYFVANLTTGPKVIVPRFRASGIRRVYDAWTDAWTDWSGGELRLAPSASVFLFGSKAVAAGSAPGVQRRVNVWYPGETAEMRIAPTNVVEGTQYSLRVLDWQDRTVLTRAYDPECGGRISFTMDDVGGRFGAYRVQVVKDGAVLGRTAFAFLTSPKVKPVPWIGTGGHVWKADYVQGPPEKKDGPYLDMLEAAGVGVFRQDFCWQGVESREKGHYEISEGSENLFSQLERRGIAWQLLMTWKNDLYENPLDPDGFAAFCGWTAKHWKGRAKRYEIFNEPHNTPWREVYPREGRDSNSNLIWVVKFAEFCRKASDAIHAADPEATVAVTGEDVDWLLYDMIRLGCAQKDDLISFHPYCHFQARPEREYWFNDDGRFLRELAAANGGAKRFCITEAGWTTFEGKMKYLEIAGCYPRSSFEHQARYLTRMYLLAHLTGLEYACQYNWKDEGLDPRYTEHNFGQLFYDATPKPAFAATAFLARLLGESKPIGELSPERAKYRLAAFDVGKGRRVIAAWCVEGECEVPLPIPEGGRIVKVLDLFGNETTLSSTGASSPSPVVRLTENPVYVLCR